MPDDHFKRRLWVTDLDRAADLVLDPDTGKLVAEVTADRDGRVTAGVGLRVGRRREEVLAIYVAEAPGEIELRLGETVMRVNGALVVDHRAVPQSLAAWARLSVIDPGGGSIRVSRRRASNLLNILDITYDELDRLDNDPLSWVAELIRTAQSGAPVLEMKDRSADYADLPPD